MRAIKKLVIFVIAVTCAFALYLNASAYATTLEISENIEVKGAEIRTTGTKQGLRFVGSIKDAFATEQPTVVGYGLLVAYGDVSTDDIYVGSTPNEKALANYYADKEELDEDDNGNPCVKFTIFNIPERFYNHDMTARMYAKLANGTYVYSKNARTRNIENVAREAYSKSTNFDETDNLINEIVNKGKIRVIHSDGTKAYVNDIASLAIQSGDTIDFLKGSYDGVINVTVNNVIIKGVYAGILGTSSSRNDNYETVLTSNIVVKDGVSDVLINGLKFTGEQALKLEDSQSNITFEYSKVEQTGNYGISDGYVVKSGYGSVNHNNITILKNKFSGKNDTENRLVYFQGYVNGINIESNTFESDASAGIKANEYGVKLNRIKANSTVTILSNSFKQRYANYQIDLANSHSNTNYLKANITIEDNTGIGASDGDEFAGNGFRILWVGTESTINFIHNYRFRFSRYYNTIFFTESEGVGSSDVNPGSQDPTINIKYNKLYGDSNGNIANPGRETTLDTNYVEIGLGFKVDASNITVTQNYFSGTARGYAFKSNSSTKSSKNIYGEGKITQIATVSGHAECDTLYEAYKASK